MSNVEIVFLGTASMVPSPERNHPSVFFRYFGDCFLLDCGEGTQRQLIKSGIFPTKIDYIFISHWHGDHSLGVPGILESISYFSPHKKVVLIGPEGTKKSIEFLEKAFKLKSLPNIEVIECALEKGAVVKVIDKDDYYVEVIGLDHNVPTLGFSFKEKDKLKADKQKLKEFGLYNNPLVGKLKRGETIEINGKIVRPEDILTKIKGMKVTYIVDTRIFPELIEFVKDSDILIVECMYSLEHKDIAREYKHLSVEDVVTLIDEGNVREVYITHVSQRYRGKENKIIKDIRERISNKEVSIKLAEDFMRIVIR